MPDSLISSPLAGARAFSQDSEVAAWSQAGLLVTLGVQLTDDSDVLDDLPPGAVRVPALRRPFGRKGADRMIEEASWDFGPAGSAVTASGSQAEVRARLWSRATTATAAAALIYLGMDSRHDVVQVVSASEVLRLGGTADAQAITILAEGCRSPNHTIRTVAANGLASARPDHPALRGLTTDRAAVPHTRTATTASLLVHGTFARLGSTWWKPRGYFFEYIKDNVTSDLYDEPQGFRWTGRYSQSHRTAAAQDLAKWLKAASVDLNMVFAHSHGGNVVLDAAAGNEARMSLLILLSVPARRRSFDEWSAITRNVRRIFALRSHCDLVVMCDRARQEYSDPPVRTVVLRNTWFSHDAVLSPEVWQRHNLPEHIRHERLLAGATS